MIENGQVWFVSDGSHGNDSIGVRACVHDQCTGIHLMQITVSRINEKGLRDKLYFNIFKYFQGRL